MLGWALPAAAAASPVARPRPLCIPPDGLVELSGLAADGQHWFAVADDGQALRVVILDRDCDVVAEINAAIDPYDVEDLALGVDGTLWLADTGDNDLDRQTVALHRLSRDGHARLFRLTFPDGPHNTEALLLDRAGEPYLVTKDVLGPAQVYRPAGKLAAPGPTPLEQVAQVRLGPTGTPGGPIGRLGSMVVTAGTVSADGNVLALRTYTDAYLFRVPEGNVVRALSGEPVRVPLPGAPQGEAIALSPDGTLLVASEGLAPVRAVPDALDLLAGHSGSASAPPPAGRSTPPADEAWSIWSLVALVLAAVAVRMLFRKRPG